ncbi:unnamed protein product [Amoebophrya sp. A25]|nr:unnamed protein product [Amoebophrya sp. A25]|eukprot:GSA25T00018767001.1
MLRFNREDMEELPPEAVPIQASGQGCMVSKDTDVLVSKFDDEDQTREKMAQELEPEEAFEREAMAFGKENKVFEELWTRTYMERQARLLENQINMQNHQQKRLTDTLQEVARAMASAGGEQLPMPSAESLRTVQDEVRAELEQSKRELAAQVQHSAAGIEQLVQQLDAQRERNVATELSRVEAEVQDVLAMVSAAKAERTSGRAKTVPEVPAGRNAKPIFAAKGGGNSHSKISGASGTGKLSGSTSGNKVVGGSMKSLTARKKLAAEQQEHNRASKSVEDSNKEQGQQTQRQLKPSQIPTASRIKSAPPADRTPADGSSQFARKAVEQRTTPSATIAEAQRPPKPLTTSDIIGPTVFDRMAERLFPKREAADASGAVATRPLQGSPTGSSTGGTLLADSTSKTFGPLSGDGKLASSGILARNSGQSQMPIVRREPGMGVKPRGNITTGAQLSSSLTSATNEAGGGGLGQTRGVSDARAPFATTSDGRSQPVSADSLAFYQDIKAELTQLSTRELPKWNADDGGTQRSANHKLAYNEKKKRVETVVEGMGRTSYGGSASSNASTSAFCTPRPVSGSKDTFGIVSQRPSKQTAGPVVRSGASSAAKFQSGIDLPDYAKNYTGASSAASTVGGTARSRDGAGSKLSSATSAFPVHRNRNALTQPGGGVTMSTVRPAHLIAAGKSELVKTEAQKAADERKRKENELAELDRLAGYAEASPSGALVRNKVTGQLSPASAEARRDSLIKELGKQRKLQKRLQVAGMSSAQIREISQTEAHIKFKEKVTKPVPFSFDPDLRREGIIDPDTRRLLQMSENEKHELIEEAEEAAAMARLVQEREAVENAKREEELVVLRTEAKRAQEALQVVLDANAEAKRSNGLAFEKMGERLADNGEQLSDAVLGGTMSKLKGVIGDDQSMSAAGQTANKTLHTQLHLLNPAWNATGDGAWATKLQASPNRRKSSSPRTKTTASPVRQLYCGASSASPKKKEQRSPSCGPLDAAKEALKSNVGGLGNSSGADHPGLQVNGAVSPRYYFSSPPGSSSNSKASGSPSPRQPPMLGSGRNPLGGPSSGPFATTINWPLSSSAASSQLPTHRSDATALHVMGSSGGGGQHHLLRSTETHPSVHGGLSHERVGSPEEMLVLQKEREYDRLADRLKKKYKIEDVDVSEAREMLKTATEYRELRQPSTSVDTQYLGSSTRGGHQTVEQLQRSIPPPLCQAVDAQALNHYFEVPGYPVLRTPQSPDTILPCSPRSLLQSGSGGLQNNAVQKNTVQNLESAARLRSSPVYPTGGADGRNVAETGVVLANSGLTKAGGTTVKLPSPILLEPHGGVSSSPVVVPGVTTSEGAARGVYITELQLLECLQAAENAGAQQSAEEILRQIDAQQLAHNQRVGLGVSSQQQQTLQGVVNAASGGATYKNQNVLVQATQGQDVPPAFFREILQELISSEKQTEKMEVEGEENEVEKVHDAVRSETKAEIRVKRTSSSAKIGKSKSASSANKMKGSSKIGKSGKRKETSSCADSPSPPIAAAPDVQQDADDGEVSEDILVTNGKRSSMEISTDYLSSSKVSAGGVVRSSSSRLKSRSRLSQRGKVSSRGSENTRSSSLTKSSKKQVSVVEEQQQVFPSGEQERDAYHVLEAAGRREDRISLAASSISWKQLEKKMQGTLDQRQRELWNALEQRERALLVAAKAEGHVLKSELQSQIEKNANIVSEKLDERLVQETQRLAETLQGQMTTAAAQMQQKLDEQLTTKRKDQQQTRKLAELLLYGDETASTPVMYDVSALRPRPNYEKRYSFDDSELSSSKDDSSADEEEEENGPNAENDNDEHAPMDEDDHVVENRKRDEAILQSCALSEGEIMISEGEA